MNLVFGATGGGTAPQKNKVLEHLEYDEATETLRTLASFEAGLNSFLLGSQHRMSSGGDNVYFTNLTKGMHFYGTHGAFKDQHLVVNQGLDGIMQSSVRTYTDETFVSIDNAEGTGYIPYQFANFPIVNDRVSFGLKVILGQDLEVGTKVKFTISRGDTGI